MTAPFPTDAPISLCDAPVDQPLLLHAIHDRRLAAQLEKIGLSANSRLTRLDETLTLRTIRVESASGQAILSGGMGLKTIIHLDDGRRLPLMDMEVGQSGHIEGTTGGRSLTQILETLGLKEDEPITLIRKLPPMEYRVRLENNQRITLSEGDAARIWGECEQSQIQFSLASAHKTFQVARLLGGHQAQQRLVKDSIQPGSDLVLESVRSVQDLCLAPEPQLVINSQDGLHLHLSQEESRHISVYVL
nr:FeoA family protein [uncultured Desulfuromonas sp.]